MFIIVLIVLIITLLFYYLKTHYEYWEKRGVPGPKPKYFVGNLRKAFLMTKSHNQIYTDIYKQFPNSPFVGIYKGHSRALLIRDPELIKEVMVKSFSHFQNNDIDVDKDVDPIFGRHPLCLRGEEWKTVRAQLTSSFTSGKMKYIYPLLEDTAEKLVKFIEKQPDAFNGKGYEAKELSLKFTLNNVASCAFGLEANCFEDENSEFRQLAKKFLSPGSWANLIFVFMIVVPPITKFLRLKMTPKDVEDKIIDIIAQTVKYREKNNITRNDFLHLIIELKKTCKAYEFTDIDVAAHAAGFFGDGYETSAVVMSFMLYEIAANPQVQSKLREEITQAFKANKGKLPYEALQGLSYLDNVFDETMRKHPPVFTLLKVCNKTFTYEPNNDTVKPIVIEPGTSIVLPVFGLQHDPEHYEDPETFKPERFSAANKGNINKYTYLPFGEGPRVCLGQRFGTLQIKVGVAHILKNFELSVNKKTRIPIEYDPTYLLASPLGGFWLDFKKITE